MTDDILSIAALAEGAQELELQPGRPLNLLDVCDIFVVTAGRAIVFAQLACEGAAIGERVHVATFGAGSLLLGMRCEGASAGLTMEVATDPGTVLHRCVCSCPKGGQVALAVEAWFTAMVPRTSHPHKHEAATLKAGEPCTLAAGGMATADRLLWVARVPGLDIEVDGLPVTASAEMLPVCPGICVVARETVEIVPCDSAALFAEERGKSLLAGAVSILLNVINSRCEEILQGFGPHLYRRQAMEEAAHSCVLEDLRCVIDARGDREETYTTGHPFLDCCRMVATAAGIELPDHMSLNESFWVSPIDQVCHAGRFRCREVTLNGKWWTRQNGPLLGQDDRGDPVALLPKRGRYYAHLFDGEKAGKTRLVDASYARTLDEKAWTFYRPLPPRPLQLRDLLRFAVRGSSSDLYAIIGLAVAVSLINLVAPYAVGKLIDQVVPSASRNDLFTLIVLLASSAFSLSMLSLASSFAVLRTQTRAEYSLMAALLDRVVSSSASFLRGFSAGDLCQRVMGVDRVRETLTQSVIASLFAGVSSLSYLFLIFYYSRELALTALGFALMILVFTGVMSALQIRFQHHIQHRLGRLDALLLQLFSGIEKIRIAAAERRMFTLWGHEFSDLWSNEFRSGLATNVLTVFNSGYSIIASMVLFWIFVHSGSNTEGTVSTGMFMAVYSALSALLLSAATLGSAIMPSMLVVPVYTRLKPVLQTIPEGSSTIAEVGPLRGDVRVEGITFRYGENLPAVLEDVSIRACRGEFVAIVGPSGSGKSTLLKILLGIEAPLHGEVFYDGRSLTRLDVHSVRRQIGVVMQDTRIMPGFIRDLLIGSARLTIEDAWAAARLAGIEEEIRAMPMGMFTYINDATVSGGQRQRMLIARALATRPRLLFFDEATSALDSESQAVVRESIDKLGVTRIVIAHRLSTIVGADRIYVLDAGRIVQCGTFEELMAQEGRFRKLAERQLL